MNKNKSGRVILVKAIRNRYFKSFSLFLFTFLFFGCPILSSIFDNDESTNSDGDSDIVDYLYSIEGSWLATESVRSLTISNLHVLFQYPNPVPPGNTVTYGNFQYVSYDGTTVSIFDYDDNIVSFFAFIENDILTISGLNTIKAFDDPYDPRDYRPWNTTYSKQ